MSRAPTGPLVPVPPSFVKQYGSQMVASFVNATLYGIGLTMVIQYFSRHGRRDPWLVKCTVGLLCLLATLETIFTEHQTYANFVYTFGQYSELNTIVWSVSGKFLFVYLTSFVAQIFFAWCIWIVSKNLSVRYRALVIPVVLLACMQISSGIVQVFYMATSDKFSVLGAKKFWNKRVTAMQGGGSAACDVLITVSLILIFRATGSSNRSGDKSIISKLTKFALNRAAATSICAILYVALFYRNMGTYYFMVPCLASTHFNVISVTSLLMSRETLRQEIDRLTFNHSDPTRHAETDIEGVATLAKRSDEISNEKSIESV